LPELKWPGKWKIVDYDEKISPVALKEKPELSYGTGDNIIIYGDNLKALKALLPDYAGKIKCVYIDPPYNTGKENRVYNDNANSHTANTWLKNVMGADFNKLSNNDKWLSMMYPRLKLLKKLLKQDGVIFVSIDDNEHHHLRCIMDEVFGKENHVIDFVWKYNQAINFGGIKPLNEYVVCYARDKNSFEGFFYSLGKKKEIISRLTKVEHPTSRITFPAGLKIQGVKNKVFKGKVGGRSEPIKIISEEMRFENGVLKEDVVLEAQWSSPQIIKKILKGEKAFDRKGQEYKEIFFNRAGTPQYRKVNNKEIVTSIIENVGSARTGTFELERIFGRKVFEFPKPVALIKHIIKIATGPGDIVLDSFAGSGTTGHAVLELNKEDGLNRKFILIEMMDYCYDITAERIKRVIKGYFYKNKSRNRYVEGTGSGFRFFELEQKT